MPVTGWANAKAKWASSAEVASFLGVSGQRVRYLCRKHSRFQAVKTGRDWRILKADVEAYAVSKWRRNK